jgi:hypothetical protein
MINYEITEIGITIFERKGCFLFNQHLSRKDCEDLKKVISDAEKYWKRCVVPDKTTEVK